MPSDHVDHPKAWYHPIEDYHLAKKAVNYTISQGIDVIIPPGDFDSFQWAVKIANEGFQLSDTDLNDLKYVAGETVPLFPLKQR